MIKYIIHVFVLCFLLPLFTLQAQVIVKAEYFIDVDPGYGNAIDVDVNEGEDVSLNFDIDLSGLQAGFHKLYLRALDDQSSWSSVYVHSFYVPDSEEVSNLNYVEYFIDNDPGYGNGSSMALEAGQDVEVNSILNLAGLEDGFHKAYLRAKDENNSWSSVYVHPFYVFTKEPEANIVELEYFVDEDPGEGQGTVLSVSEPSTDVGAEFTIDLSDYTHGESHTLYIRAKDENGKWGFCYSGAFERNYITIYLNPEDAGVVAEYGIFDIGETAEVSVTPNPGYSFINWTENGTELSTDLTYSFELAGAHDLTANFEFITFDINAVAMPSEGGTIEGTGSFRADTSIKLTAIPNEGYRFNSWVEDGNELSTDSIYSITVSSDRDLQAYFDLVDGIDEGIAASIRLYPNPAQDFVVLQVQLQNKEKYTVTIVDLSGRQQLSEQRKANESKIDLAGFSNGVYILKVRCGDSEFVQRLIVE